MTRGQVICHISLRCGGFVFWQGDRFQTNDRAASRLSYLLLCFAIRHQQGWLLDKRTGWGMARSVRRQCESNIYHVISRGTGRQIIFEDDDDREMFLRLLEKSTADYSVQVLAWCLMGNHFHLLLRAPLGDISACMKALCGRYAQLFNAVHGRVGHLFQERFKSEPVEDEPYLAVVVSYIHFNPEKAGLCRFDRYPWSSYAEYLGGGRARGICATEFVLDYFGGVEEFERFHAVHAVEAQCMDVDLPRLATRSMRDEDAILLATEVLGGARLADVKALPRDARNDALGKLLKAGLSIRQIERLTGIGRGVIQSIPT